MLTVAKEAFNDKEKYPWHTPTGLWFVVQAGTLEGPNQTKNGPTVSLPNSVVVQVQRSHARCMWSNYTRTDVHPMFRIPDHTFYFLY
jgi:hypothetical protein